MSLPQHLYFPHLVYSFNGYPLSIYCKPSSARRGWPNVYSDTLTQLEVLWGT